MMCEFTAADARRIHGHTESVGLIPGPLHESAPASTSETGADFSLPP